MKTEQEIRNQIRKLRKVIANMRPGDNDGIFLTAGMILNLERRHQGSINALEWVLKNDLPFTDPPEQEAS